MLTVAAISIGAALGALLRWVFSVWFNPTFPLLPPGTLLANLIGGYLIGVAVAFFGAYSSVAVEWRLFAITGFLGGLTTFSTFSAEVVLLMQQGRLGWAFATISVHLLGSLAMTFLGIATFGWLHAR